MDKTFQLVTVIAVAAIGIYALYMGEKTLAATALGVLGGILASPKAQQPAPPAKQQEAGQ